MKTNSKIASKSKKYALKLLLASLLLTITAAIAVHAKTPDGKTPAKETVCDVLKADGVTKGLYGLCVSFCEAHDFAEVETPLTEEEVLALASDGASGRILRNYNKLKKADDPEMPCIVPKQDSLCPCFTEAELLAVEGVNDATQEQVLFRCDEFVSPDPANSISIVSKDERALNYTPLSGGSVFQAVDALNSMQHRECRYFNNYVVPAEYLRIDDLTEEEFQACYNMLTATCPAE